ncbi:unnamed protein product [Rotaria sp. Silwood1]|nr:unnamed protein product [Rotaria sp. Silwood1]CAF1635196.1 unnamed protein product [Rotaria sp. Silwood1]CAF3818462.1 unnamed protein product [Rotaria sp. Silwood1]CAF3842549.1 unnamed protein product [Rotaria sp. Silwood1]CAF3890523.1 unnamed protein product [Rotaria sp. Silwood1]
MATTPLAALLVIAHPDDETFFTGFVYALTHRLNASVDLVCVTNGEGGFGHAGPSEPLYGNLKLSDETVARKHLPRIRQQELFDSGRILGIRKYFFFNQVDLEYTRDVNIIFKKHWDKEWVIEQFQQTIKNGNGANGYDLMIIMLPNVDSHGHHTASGLLALEAIDRLQRLKSVNVPIPTVIGGSEFVLTKPPTYPGDQLTSVLTNVTTSEFRFNLNWKMSNSPHVDYKTIRLWMAAEHKSQGIHVYQMLTKYDRDEEQYFYFSINEQYCDSGRLAMIQNLFTQLANMHHS